MTLYIYAFCTDQKIFLSQYEDLEFYVLITEHHSFCYVFVSLSNTRQAMIYCHAISQFDTRLDF